jgi:hypothetical protein
MTISKLILCLSIIPFLLSCTANGPIFEAQDAISDDKALVYIYNNSSDPLPGPDEYPLIKIDGTTVGKIRQGGYCVFEVVPDRRKLTLHPQYLPFYRHYEITLETEFVAGKTYYFRIVYGTKKSTTFKPANERRALKELADSRKVTTSKTVY